MFSTEKIYDRGTMEISVRFTDAGPEVTFFEGSVWQGVSSFLSADNLDELAEYLKSAAAHSRDIGKPGC